MSNKTYLALISLAVVFPSIAAVLGASLRFDILGILGIITLGSGLGCFILGFSIVNAEPQSGGGNVMAALIIFFFSFLCIVGGIRLGALTSLERIFKMLF